MNMVARFVLDAVNDSKKMQELKGTLLEGETKDELEHFQNYGFTSNPPKGSEGLAFGLNGNRDHTVIICVDSREFRKKGLAAGEVAVYSKFGSYIHFKSDGTIEINGNTKVKGTLDTTKDITSAQDVITTQHNTSLGGTKTVYNSHTHQESGGGSTQDPNQQI